MKKDAPVFQSAYSAYLEQKIISTFQAQVGNKFRAIQHAGGFNYMTQIGLNYNDLTLKCLDALVKTDDDGNLDLEEGGFSKLYGNVLACAEYKLSSSSQKAANDAMLSYDAQVTAVIKAYQAAGLPELTSEEPAAMIAEIYENCAAKFGGPVDEDCSIIPNSYAQFKMALQTLNNDSGEALQLVMNQGNMTGYCKQLVSNVTGPKQSNGGLPIDNPKGAYYVAYDKIPSPNTLNNGLNTAANAITICVEGESYEENAMQLYLDNKVAGVIPIAGLIDIQLSHESLFDMNQLRTAQTTFSGTITYSGLTVVPVQPAVFDQGSKSGWYDAIGILRQMREKTGRDVDGFQLTGSTYDVDTLFGGQLARLNLMLISRTPTISVTLSHVNMDYARSVFQMNNDVSVTLFGFIKVGGHANTYKTTAVEYNEEEQSVTLTFGEPVPGGTPDEKEQTAFIVGGVPDYPGVN